MSDWNGSGRITLNGTVVYSQKELDSVNTYYLRNKMEKEKEEMQKQTELLRRQTEAIEQANKSNSYNPIKYEKAKYESNFLESVEREKRLKEADKEFRRKLAIKQVEEKLGVSENEIRIWFSYYSGAATIDLANRVVELRSSIEIINRKLNTAIFFRKRLENRLKDLKIECKQTQEKCLALGEERFNTIQEFRQNHYCKEAEDLIEKLDLHLGKIDKVIKEGTIEDYTNFIKEDLKRRR